MENVWLYNVKKWSFNTVNTLANIATAYCRMTGCKTLSYFFALYHAHILHVE